MKMKCTFFESVVVAISKDLDCTFAVVMDLVATTKAEARKNAEDLIARDCKSFPVETTKAVAVKKVTANIEATNTNEDAIIKDLKKYVVDNGLAEIDFVICNTVDNMIDETLEAVESVEE